MSPSKYDAVAQDLCTRLNADALVLVVINGNMGSGACRAEQPSPKMPRATLRTVLARVLRDIADHVDADDVRPILSHYTPKN